MAELAEAVAEIARYHDMYREQGLEIDRLAAVQNRPLQVNIEAISDLIPDSFSGTDDSVSSDDFFKKFVSWLGLHRNCYCNVGSPVFIDICLMNNLCLCIMIMPPSMELSNTVGMDKKALIWWTNLLGSQQTPVNVPDIQAAFFAKYRYRKTRSQLKAELNQCKYQPGESNIGMMNRFITIADKLEWPVAI